jgi:hypothetical protein
MTQPPQHPPLVSVGDAAIHRPSRALYARQQTALAAAARAVTDLRHQPAVSPRAIGVAAIRAYLDVMRAQEPERAPGDPDPVTETEAADAELFYSGCRVGGLGSVEAMRRTLEKFLADRQPKPAPTPWP